MSHLHHLLRRGRQAWVDQFLAGALMFALLPALNLLTTRRHLGITIANDDWVRAGFDLGLLVIGAILAAIAWKIARYSGAAPLRRSRKSLPHSSTIAAGAAE